jgi:cysteine-rich repeat protein
MKLRTIGLAVVLSAGLFQTSDALVRPKGAESPVVAAGLAPRAHRTIAWSRASQLAAVGLPGWTAMWDRDTDVPVRLWGSGVFAAGSVTAPSIAEATAHDFLAKHLALLAPGAKISDFVLVANQLGGAGDVRSVGFAQYAGGVRVVGGAVGFSFKNDRLIMVSSTALPNVTVPAAPQRLDANRIGASAIGWLALDGHAVTVRATRSDRVILPLVRPRDAKGPAITYRLAEQLSVESKADPGRWDVWVDAADASPIARRSTIFFASGTVMFDVPDRAPTLTRSPKPAPNVVHQVNGTATTSTADGTVTWAAAGAATVAPGLSGPLVEITNKAGALTTDTLALPSGGSVTWSKATDEFSDAQLSSFVFASVAKEFARTRLNPTLAYFDQQLSVNVNENSTCNAYSTGDDIHFYRRTSGTTPTQGNCENTGRMADVVYHEFGHSVHANSIIAGVGQFDGSLSEGLADTLAASITNDHGMGRGFFFTDAPLRDLDPVGLEKRWPEDADGEVHDEGEIIGEALWDLRKGLIAKLGETAGIERTLEIYYGIMQRAADIPTSYAEALVSDDDDGDLGNGTPNLCELNAAFGAHGLADARATLGISVPVRDVYKISMAANPPASSSACPGPTITSAVVDWKLRDGDGGTVDLVAEGATYSASIPAQPYGSVVQYKVTVTLSDGTKLSYPDNAADPMYEFYTGDVEALWCADFEAGAADWTHGAAPTNRDEWEAGSPMGLGGDPRTAFGGTGVFGIDLSNDGMYRPRVATWAESPEIDLAGNTNVRLQYRRWLGVEDGFFDKARIMANGTKVWGNFSSPADPMAAGVNHIDKEWRFQDVDLAAQTATGKLKLRFELDTDQGANFGGWTLDDVCVVITKAGPTCGNGTVDTGETCDDGNVADGDGCSATCVDENSDGAGCCSVGTNPAGAIALGVLSLAMVLRRRRRA